MPMPRALPKLRVDGMDARRDAPMKSSPELLLLCQDVNASELAPCPCLSDPSGRLSGHFPAAACRRDLSDTPQLAAAEISF